MKKSLCLLLSATLAFSMTACSVKKEASDVEPTTAPTATEAPTTEPTSTPTEVPDNTPTAEPTAEPTEEPTEVPTETPIATTQPTKSPEATKAPTKTPAPTKAPSKPTSTPKPTSKPKPTATPKPTKAPTATPEAPAEKKSLEDMMSTILDGVDLPMVFNTTVDKDNFPYYLGIEAIPGAEALASDGAMTTTAHSVVLLRVPSKSDVKSVAKDVEANANPRKWICVGAEKVSVSYKDDVILLVMSKTETVDAVVKNFENQ
ncbi:PT repeat-containing protein [Lachnoclostridium phytofermentans]|uniref:PT repeat-containing protein n=1 Tax=Lachnoclostridium phytofermentans (strain ATCC 700394 / DSM 18823 / ISDg) TaxID=357809 RepID=A9KKB5_LACP7|nr:PT repeat-containing protein [Lachnoclostridium phytofermentans]ABX44106.1 PT repeat-containing protein [Lachnoclostridium phytofermentans ISDg]